MSDPTAAELASQLREEGLKNFMANKLRDGDVRMGKIEHSVSDLRKDVDEMRTDVKSVLEILDAVKGGLRVLGWFGFAIKWAAGIVGGISIVLAAFGKIPWPWK